MIESNNIYVVVLFNLPNSLFLRQFAVEVLQSSLNSLIRQVRRTLERNSFGHDDSYLLWAIKFFLEYNRKSSFELALVRYVAYPYYHQVMHLFTLISFYAKRGDDYDYVPLGSDKNTTSF